MFYRAPGDLCRCPQQQYVTGEPGKVQGRDRVGIVKRSCGYQARRVSAREKSFYRETRGTIIGDCHVAIRRSDPRVAYTEVKVQVRDLVRVVGILASFSQRAQYSGKFHFIELPDSLPRSQSSGTGPSAGCGYCCRLCPTGGQYSVKIQFIKPQG